MKHIDRSPIYGEPHLSHENIGLSWQGLIQQHYQIRLPHSPPPWLVELMMVAFKAHRSARVYHEDNYDDMLTYASFAKHGQEKPGTAYELSNQCPDPEQNCVDQDRRSPEEKELWERLLKPGRISYRGPLFEKEPDQGCLNQDKTVPLRPASISEMEWVTLSASEAAAVNWFLCEYPTNEVPLRYDGTIDFEALRNEALVETVKEQYDALPTSWKRPVT